VKNILMASDGSESAAQALEVAIALAKENGAQLHVVSVRPPRVAGRAGAAGPMLEVEDIHGPEQIAEAAAQHARDAGVTATPHTAHGDVADCIADAATSLGVDLLVVGAHGPLRGALMGSVAHALIHRSPVPLTVVRHFAPVGVVS
jgi:nucleotide-binding universal stress UspA family protein